MDTSGSMNQRTSLGQTYLDMGKTAIESFLKIRQKAADSWKDRYMLVTCEEFPDSVKVGWRENGTNPNDHTAFLQALKQLVAVNMTNIGGAMKCSLDLLNVHRLSNGMDNYGQGRNPYLLEPAVIIVISDGCKLSTSQSVADELILPMHSSYPGSELTKEPFRWDQRIFSMVLRFKGNSDSDFSENVNCESHVKLMCDVTGGKSYVVSSLKALNQSLESISQKILSGVVLNMEKLPCDSERGLAAEVWHSTRRMILVKPTTQKIAHWPIPESFWPSRDVKPTRMAIPTIHFKCENKAVNVIEHLPFDKYELEPSPLTQQILELRLPNTCWQTFVLNSGKDKGVKHTFGYLKASIKGTCVNLFVMPYNYPVLFPLLEELLNELKMIPTGKWMSDFKIYIGTVPQYYYQPLRTALRRLGVPNSLINLIPEPIDTHFQIYLKKLKEQGRAEAVRFNDQIKTAKENLPKKLDVPRKFVDIRDVINEMSLQKLAINQSNSIIKNPYHTTRTTVLSQLNLLRKEIGLMRSGSTCTSEHSRFNLPISKMGLYQESISKQLRVVECSASQKTNHTFGNPFKLGSSKKMNNMMADEIDEFGNMQRNVANKRRHVPLKQYKTPPNSAVSPVIVNLDPSTPLSNFGNFAPSPITNNVAPAPNLSNNKPRAPTPPPNNKFPVPPPVNNVPLPRPPPPAVIAPPAVRIPENNKTKDKSKPVTPFPNWFLNTQSSDIAAAIGGSILSSFPHSFICFFIFCIIIEKIFA